MCVSWDSKVSNWMEDGCQVAVNENGTVERNNDIINCTCNRLGIYGVRVVSYKRFEEWQKGIRLLCVEMCLYHTAEHKSCDVYRSLLCARQHQNTLPAYVLEYWVLVCALCERTASLPPSPFLLPPPPPPVQPSLPVCSSHQSKMDTFLEVQWPTLAVELPLVVVWTSLPVTLELPIESLASLATPVGHLIPMVGTAVVQSCGWTL